jgi:ribose transport system ATP-binding protein
MVSIKTDEQRVSENPTAILSGISKSYGGVHALTDVTLEVFPGEVHALLGENGAGKSTLMGIASGQIDPDEGEILFEGLLQPQLTPTDANELGIAMVHQHPALLPDLTVEENLRLGIPSEHLQFAGSTEASMRALLDEVGMTVHLHDRVDTLSVANKHLLEVAKALAASPKLLILDEPTAPLGKDSVDLLFEHVRTAAARGTAVVYITHRLAEVRLLADRVTVLRDGIVSGSAAVDDVTDDQLLAWIVGRRLIGSAFPPKPVISDEAKEYLKAIDLTGEAFADVSFSVRQGEILGVAGVVGNGQSELLAALAGLTPFAGSVEISSSPFPSPFPTMLSAWVVVKMVWISPSRFGLSRPRSETRSWLFFSSIR